MDRKSWTAKIKQTCKKMGVDVKAYAPIIDTLAVTLEQRDNALDQFIEDGARPVVEYTNKAGASNLVKNPMLTLWDDLNKSALAYWRELGLTPAGYKKIMGDAPKKEKESGLEAALLLAEKG